MWGKIILKNKGLQTWRSAYSFKSYRTFQSFQIKQDTSVFIKRNFSSYEERKRDGLKSMKNYPILAGYGVAIGALIVSGNINFIPLPAIWGALHFIKLQGGLSHIITSYNKL